MLPLVARPPILRTVARAPTPAVNTASTRRAFLATKTAKRATDTIPVGATARKVQTGKKKAEGIKDETKTSGGNKFPLGKLTKAQLPPTRPGNPYVFLIKERMVNRKGTTLDETRALMSTVAKEWREFTDEQKAPYIQKYKESMDVYKHEREKYWTTVPLNVLTAINKQRQTDGLKRLQRKTYYDEKKPLSSFFRFAAEFRKSPEAEEIRRQGPVGSDSVVIRIAKEGGARWHGLSHDQKRPYLDAFDHDFQEWKKNHTTAD